MATISQILDKRWPGREWTIEGDDYDSLIWGHHDEAGDIINTNPEAKPTLAAILAFANDVDLELEADLRDERRETAMNQVSIGQWFKMIDTITDYLVALHTALPGNVKNQIPANVVNRAQALRNKLNEIIAQHP